MVPFLGAGHPYGYRFVKDSEDAPPRFEEDPHEAKVVRTIYDWYTSGHCSSYRKVQEELYARGIKTRRGRPTWSHSVICSIISDTTYVGTTHYNKTRCVAGESKPGEYRRSKNTKRLARPKDEWIPIAVPAIVSEEIYEKAQQVKARNTRHSARHTKAEYLIRNLIACGECGTRMRGNYVTSQWGRYFYYRCILRLKVYPRPCDHSFSIRRNLVDSIVWNGLEELLTSPEALLAKINQTATHEAASDKELSGQLNQLTRELERLQEKRRRTLEAYKENLLTLDEFKKATAEFTSEKTELARKRADLEQKADDSPRPLTRETAKEIATAYTRKVQDLDFDRKQKLVQAIVKNVKAQRNEVIVTCSLPGSLNREPSASIAFEPLKRPERNPTYPFELVVPIRKLATGEYVVA